MVEVGVCYPECDQGSRSAVRSLTTKGGPVDPGLPFLFSNTNRNLAGHVGTVPSTFHHDRERTERRVTESGRHVPSLGAGPYPVRTVGSWGTDPRYQCPGTPVSGR